MALSNLIFDSRYVQQTGAVALSLFNASICCGVEVLMISRSQSRRNWCPEWGYTVKRVNAIFSLCYTLCRVSLKRIPTISFFKHVIIWQVDFYELTHCFKLCVNSLLKMAERKRKKKKFRIHSCF